MDVRRIDELLELQDGVISRAQVLKCGGGPHDIRRKRRRREWTTLIDGVYVAHTGEPTWEQRAVAGVLHACRLDHELWPIDAALGGHAAIRNAVTGPWRHHRKDAPIMVCVDLRRTIRPVRGFRFARVNHLQERVEWNRMPPRLKAAEAALDLALDAGDPLDAVGMLADACQTRCVTAPQITSALEGRGRVAGRAELTAILTDIGNGTCSVLEHQFLEKVVRPHALPEPVRQEPRVIVEKGGRRREYRDAVWGEWGTGVELDGRLFHDNAAQRDVDLDRDLDDAVDGRLAIRLGWGRSRSGPVIRPSGWGDCCERVGGRATYVAAPTAKVSS